AIQTIQLPGSDPFILRCYADKNVGSAWMEVLFKFQFSTKFNRSYEQYINGFGEVKYEFFIGLQRLHLLTNRKPHEVIIYYTTDRGFELRCNNFILGNKSEGYNLKKVDGCRGHVWLLTQGTKFSTFDRDEDGNPDRNRATEFGNGWWFTRCVFL
ncbi:hypothetical protein KR067_008684, partial [Drosophila pandora]